MRRGDLVRPAAHLLGSSPRSHTLSGSGNRSGPPDRGGCGDGSAGSVPVVRCDAPRGRAILRRVRVTADGTVDAAEYKQVTVLFADVVRSMDIAAVLDVERLREIMTDLVEQSAEVVQR